MASEPTDDLSYWLNDAASILRSNGTTMHADKVLAAERKIAALAVQARTHVVVDRAAVLEVLASCLSEFAYYKMRTDPKHCTNVLLAATETPDVTP